MGYPPYPGGIERYSAEIAAAYRRQGRRVLVITKSSTLPAFSLINRIPVFSVNGSNQLTIFFKMCIVWAKLKKRVSCDFIHATTWRLALPAKILPSQSPLVVSVHGLEVLKVPKYLKFIQYFILKKADVVVGVSETALKCAKQGLPAAEGKWLSSYNGLTYADESIPYCLEGKFREAVKRPIIIYTFCRLVERKNVQGAIKAIAILKRKGVNGFKYKIAGGGPMLNSLKELAKNEDVLDVIEFLGFIDESDVVNEYKQADIFLHPQIMTDNGLDIEGFGITIADAMSFGAAPIVGVAGGPNDFIMHEITGLKVDGGNVLEIANAIERLITSIDTRNTISNNAYNWSLANLSWTKHISSILAVL
ncbi:MAG: glycosyltransferase family 4 protein [Colwellia sp.]|jgi:Glycosyltransferase